MDQCDHRGGVRITFKQVFCGSCSYREDVPQTWRFTSRGYDLGEVKPGVGFTFGMQVLSSSFSTSQQSIMLASAKMAESIRAKSMRSLITGTNT